VDTKRDYLSYLTAQGVENRPIVSGNFTRQPALRNLGIACEPTAYPGAEEVHRRGFFIGLHTEELSDALIDTLAGILLSYRFDA
jgi:CDP-6-deoxy-D-xylo-4-hexulose-3-dehydrase